MTCWRSIDTVVENGRVHVLQQEVKTSLKYGERVDYGGRHRLVPLSELEGVKPNDAEVEGVDSI